MIYKNGLSPIHCEINFVYKYSQKPSFVRPPPSEGLTSYPTIRQSSELNERQREIYDALGMKYNAGEVKQTEIQ